MKKQPCVYILTNKHKSVLYTGVTSNLVKRVWQHKQHFVDSFSQKYNAELLIYFELHESILSAIKREKQLKKWRREWKEKLIAGENPNWIDLYDSII